LTRVYLRRVMPEHQPLLAQLRDGAGGLYDVTLEALGA
jgi:hypothetical protein